MTSNNAQLVAHVIFRLDVGGLENGLVNLVNGLPDDEFRHAIICIDKSTDFADRITRKDVEIVEIGKRPGTDLAALARLYRTIKRLNPEILHTRNLAALDALLPAALAGVNNRIHGEHGWDVNDLYGLNRKMRLLRKIYSPLVKQYVTVSKHLSDYVTKDVGIDQRRVTQIYNGVDTNRFHPAGPQIVRTMRPHSLFTENAVVFGTVGRMRAVKNHLGLAKAFAEVVAENPKIRGFARLVIVGDGPTREAVQSLIDEAGISDICWLAGYRDDIPDMLRLFDVYVQPSLAEGVSNTILEAMASGLPVIATDVGGSGELVLDNESGTVIPPEDSARLASAIRFYAIDSSRIRSHGVKARSRAEQVFGIDRMIDNYRQLYRRVTGSVD